MYKPRFTGKKKKSSKVKHKFREDGTPIFPIMPTKEEQTTPNQELLDAIVENQAVFIPEATIEAETVEETVEVIEEVIEEETIVEEVIEEQTAEDAQEETTEELPEDAQEEQVESEEIAE